MPGKTKVSEIMSKDVYSVTMNDTLKYAHELMTNEKIKRLPVLEDKGFIGLITEKKVMEYVLRGIYDPESTFGEEGFNKLSDFENILQRTSHVVYPEDSVQKAIKLMAKYQLDCIPVVDWEMKLVGILTVSDILFFIHNKIEDGDFDN
jgi:acetoin utilization protein AcuB